MRYLLVLVPATVFATVVGQTVVTLLTGVVDALGTVMP